LDFKRIEEILNNKETDARLHLVHWTAGGKVKTVTPTIGDQFEKNITNITKLQVNNCKKLTEEKYNIIGSNDDVVETTSKQAYKKNIDLIIESIKTPTAKFSFNNDSFDFFVYEFCPEHTEENSKKIFAFRRTKKFKSFKKGFIGHLIEGHFKKLENENLLGTDGIVDVIVYGENIAILQHIAFERIFHISNEFYENAKKVLSNKKFNKKIANFNQLKNDALKNGNYVKRLSKLGDSNVPTLFIEDLEATKKVVDSFNLGLSIKDDKIEYNDETQLGNFISLMQDAYYKTLIGNQNGVDERR
jgi:hypothetical protein